MKENIGVVPGVYGNVMPNAVMEGGWGNKNDK